MSFFAHWMETGASNCGMWNFAAGTWRRASMTARPKRAPRGGRRAKARSASRNAGYRSIRFGWIRRKGRCSCAAQSISGAEWISRSSMPSRRRARERMPASEPRISAQGMIAYVKDGQIWLVPLGEVEKPQQLVVRGRDVGQEWSPDGKQLAFMSARGDHSFIAVYDAAVKSIRYLAPRVDSDSHPKWSPDGKWIAFVRRPAATRDTPDGFFIAPDRPEPWAIWLADAATGSAHEIWRSTTTMEGSLPHMAADTGGGLIQWGAESRIVFASEQDGWQHLYSIPAAGGTPQLLTPGNCEAEQWAFSPEIGRASCREE